LLKQALHSNPLRVTQSTPMQVAQFVFIPQNLGENGATLKSQFTTHLPLTHFVPLVQVPITIDLMTNESQKAKNNGRYRF